MYCQKPISVDIVEGQAMVAAAAGKVIGDDEANKALRRQYRAPWGHPEVEKV